MLLLYFVWKYYKALADQYSKEKPWPYIILGAVVYYAGTFVGGIIIFLIAESSGTYIDESSERLLGLLGIPFGILASYLLYKYLENKWEKEYIDPSIALEAIGTHSEEEQPLIR